MRHSVKRVTPHSNAISTVRPKLPSTQQQRLFTGALFPEGINEELRSFAARHRATSNVWVPVRSVDESLKAYGIYILPNAALCDISLTTGSRTQDYTDMSASLPDRTLVNADHTSNPQLLESFREFVVAVPRPSEIRPPHALHRPNTTQQQQHVFPRFRHPLTTSGVPILHRAHRTRLIAEQERNQYHSNYWFSTGSRTNFVYHNAEETSRPGMFNPTWCVSYDPYTITGQHFPALVARLMRQRAVEFGYVSRLWLTLPTAERCFGARLSPARMADAPAVHTTFFTGGLECGTYYCADQFVCPTTAATTGAEGGGGGAGGDNETMAPLASPRLRDIELAASGVAMSAEKLRAFPLLWHLAQATSGTRQDAPPDWSRRGADTAMFDATRHTRFVQACRRYEHIQLIGDGYLANHTHTARQLEVSGLGKALQRQCVLRGFSTPFFVSARSLYDYDLGILPGEEGFVQSCPVRLNGTHAYLDGECWFNIAQLEEPEIVLRLFLQRPVHFLTRTLLPKAQALLCARLQHHLAPDQDGCGEWIPQFVLSQTSWPLRPMARGVPVVSPENLTSSLGASSRLSSARYTTVGSGAWFNMDDVELPESDKIWLRTYCPVSRHGEPFLRGVRMAMTLRAFERGYVSPVWICLEEEETLAVHAAAGGEARLHSDMPAALVVILREEAAVPLAGRALAAEGALKDGPLVTWSDLHWVNAEELARPLPDPLDPAASTTEGGGMAIGKGVSAESRALWRMRCFSRHPRHRTTPMDPDADDEDTAFQDDDTLCD